MDLIEVDNDIWVADGGTVKMLSIPFQTRMTIVRLGSGKLWLHSPVEITEDHANCIRSLGEAAYIVAPNTFHHLNVGPWLNAFPDAKLFGAEGLPKKCKQLAFDGVLTDTPEPGWAEAIDQLYFRGSKVLNEVVFLHKTSGTLIVTDIIQNHDPRDNNGFWKLVKRAVGVLAPNGGMPRDLKLTIGDKQAARQSLEKILAWEFDRLILSHGICIDKNARQYVADCFKWL